MPKVLHELAGEPLDWGVMSVPLVKGQKLKIEKAVSITDMCLEPPAGGCELVLCFFTLPEPFGLMVGVLVVKEVVRGLTSETIQANLMSVMASAMANDEAAGALVLRMIQRSHGIEPATLAAVVKENI